MVKKFQNKELLKQKHTLGRVNFDSVVIIDFGNGLKSVLTSLAYTDVLGDDVLIITANQLFDKSILNESSIKNFYFPSINFKNLKDFKKKFNEFYNYNPGDITILSKEYVGIVYYFWIKNIQINSPKDFNIKNEIKGKIGNFIISDNKIIQKLDIYNLRENTFVKNNL